MLILFQKILDEILFKVRCKLYGMFDYPGLDINTCLLITLASGYQKEKDKTRKKKLILGKKK